MLAVGLETLKVIDGVDVGLQILGGLLGAGFIVWLFRSGQWRNPLAGVAETREGPNGLHVLLIVGGVVLLYVGVGAVLTRELDRESANQPGTHAWHVVLSVDMVAKTFACIAILIVLRFYNSLAARNRLGVGRTLIVGLVAAMIVTAMTGVLLQMGATLWRWVTPDVVPPTHPVLQALAQSEWRLGTVQLIVSACFVAPVAEELFFRGLLLQALWHHTRHIWISILLSAILFGLVHQTQPQDVLPLTAMGLAVGYVRVRHRSLLACMVLHALFNGRTMFLAIVAPELMDH